MHIRVVCGVDVAPFPGLWPARSPAAEPRATASPSTPLAVIATRRMLVYVVLSLGPLQRFGVNLSRCDTIYEGLLKHRPFQHMRHATQQSHSGPSNANLR